MVRCVIVKMGDSPEWGCYRGAQRTVKAVKMIQDFLYETPHGWVQGHKGQWLVELGQRLRCNLDDEAFVLCYSPARDRRRSDHGA